MFLKKYVRVISGLFAFALVLPECTAVGVKIVPPPPIMGRQSQVLYSEGRTDNFPVENKRNLEPRNKTELTTEARFWRSDLAGRIDSRGMSLGLADETSIDSQNTGSLSGAWQFAENTRLQLDYFKFGHTGHLGRAVTFDNRNYTAGAAIRVRNNLFGVGMAQTLSDNDEGTFRVLWGVRFSKLNTRIEQSSAAGVRTGELAQSIGMPYIGVKGAARLSGSSGLTGSARFFDLDKKGEANRISDFDLAFEFGQNQRNTTENQAWYGLLGYRYFMLHDESDKNTTRVVYSGPFLGIRGEF